MAHGEAPVCKIGFYGFDSHLGVLFKVEREYPFITVGNGAMLS